MKKSEKYWHTKYGFRNPQDCEPGKVGFINGSRYCWSRIKAKPYVLGSDLPKDHILSREECLRQIQEHKDTDLITWLGHCAFIIQIDGIRFLTDPFLRGNVVAAVKSSARLPCPLSFSDLDFDVLLVSHEHTDHFHAASLSQIPSLEEKKAIVPLKVGNKLARLGVTDITELDWFDSITLPKTSLTITAVPACHYSTVPGDHTLWAGFVISSSKSGKKIYFSGDTAYGAFFKKDIAPYGPFDAALIGVGAYYLSFPSRVNYVHTNPEEAVQIAKDIDAKQLVGMHWGTVNMSDEKQGEIGGRLNIAKTEKEYAGKIVCLKIGQTVKI